MAENLGKTVSNNKIKQPLVSVICPSFNQGQFIEDTILSIKKQTYPYIEHIIIDGGSTDNTLEILKKYESSYNMRWISEPDNGMYEAINKGFRMAKGDILAYLNCDDLYFPWSVEKACQYLKENYIVYGELLNLKISNTPKVTLSFKLPFNYNFYSSFGFINQPTVFFRRELLEKIGFFNENRFKLIADCEYWLRCAQRGIIPVKVEEFLAIERDHDQMQREKKKEELLKEIAKLRAYYSNELGKYQKFKYRLLNRLYVRVSLLKYYFGLTRRWSMLKKSRIVSLNFKYILREMLPNKFKKQNHMSVKYDLSEERSIVIK